MKKLIALLLAALMLLSCVAMAEEEPFELSIDWDAEYDVIVVGLGAAGCATAITAAQTGAKVLVLEKAPEGHAGGNSAVCMQWVCMASDRDQAIAYMKSMRSGFETPTDEMIEVYVDNISQNADWLTGLGAPNVQPFDFIEFRDMEGSGGIYPVTIDNNPGLGAYGLKPSLALYKFLKKKVESFENISIWYEAPAQHLIQDRATGIVHGVQAEVNGQKVLIRAKNGVVLTCGGYENNTRMLEDYNDVHDSASLAWAIYNTGDGITMATEVGARLWHLANIVYPNTGYRFESTATTFGITYNKGLIVGGNAAIYHSVGMSSHGKMAFYGGHKQAVFPDVCWGIYDENSIHQESFHNSFSEGNEWEIAKGMIKKYDTIEELAAGTELDPEVLKASVEEYNATAEYPVVQAPFYAIRISHAVGNTQGGPERSVKGEVINVFGEPIPHLYEAGELGDVWSHCYQASCNIGGGLAFGRISGTNAAAAKDDNYQGSVMEGKTAFAPVVAETVFEAGENQYIGKGEGKSTVPMTVRVTKVGDDITDVEILDFWDTPGFSDRAVEQTIAQIIERDTAIVDTCAGITWTSVGIMSAVADALK